MAAVEPATEEQIQESVVAKSTSLVVNVPEASCDNWMSHPKAFFRGPIARLLIVFLILVQDFLLYGEDPVNDSHVECNLPGLGHLLNFVTIWRVSTASAFFRVVLILLAIIVGIYVGRQWLHHYLLRDVCGLSMFGYPEGYNGTFLAMGITIVVGLFIGVLVHNVFCGDGDLISGATGLEMRTFGKLTQSCSAIADLVAIVQVWDIVFQDRERYPEFAFSFKKIWLDSYNGWVRVVCTWIVFVGSAITCFYLVMSTGKEHEDLTIGFSEVHRCWLMSSIMFCDLFTIFQDWEFPAFASDLEAEVQVLIAGTFKSNISCDALSNLFERCTAKLSKCPCKLSKELSQEIVSFFKFRVSGQWLAYGPLFAVVCIDLFCVRVQLMYTPEAYGQYVHPDTLRIWTIIDPDYLRLAYDKGKLIKPDLVKYAARKNSTTGEALSISASTDYELNARYYASYVKWVAVIPGVLVLIFFVFVVIGGERAKRLERVTSNAVNLIADDIVGNVAEKVSNVISLSPSSHDAPAGSDGLVPTPAVSEKDLPSPEGSAQELPCEVPKESA